jgi:hypothetical protein
MIFSFTLGIPTWVRVKDERDAGDPTGHHCFVGSGAFSIQE